MSPPRRRRRVQPGCQRRGCPPTSTAEPVSGAPTPTSATSALAAMQQGHHDNLVSNRPSRTSWLVTMPGAGDGAIRAPRVCAIRSVGQRHKTPPRRYQDRQASARLWRPRKIPRLAWASTTLNNVVPQLTAIICPLASERANNLRRHALQRKSRPLGQSPESK